MYERISIAIPTYNEEKNFRRCLDSIFSQNYPAKYLDVIIVDDNSTDNTLEIAKKYPVRILKNGAKDCQRGKMIGFQHAKGDYFMYMDADESLNGTDWFQKMLKPLNEDKTINGSITKFLQHPEYSLTTRYLTYQELQLDPVFEFFSPRIKDAIIENKEDYNVCLYNPNKVPAEGKYLFRMDVLKNSAIAKKEKFMDVDNMVVLVKEGHTKYAFVPEAGRYHFTARNLRDIMRKKIRNINKNYLIDPKARHYRWFDLTKPKDVLKIAIWLLYAETLILPTLRGVYKSIKHKDFVCMLEPIAVFTLTNTIIYGFIANKFGRKFIANLLKNWLHF